MKKMVGLLFSVVLVFLLQLPLYGAMCVGPPDQNCLACHGASGGNTPGDNLFPDGWLHQHYNAGWADCSDCHCGEEQTCASPDPYGTKAATVCCTQCHDQCTEVYVHSCTYTVGDCTSCHWEPGSPGNCACVSDVDGDKQIGLFDLIIMKNEFGTSGCTSQTCQADLEGDGQVGLFDLIIMKSQFGWVHCPPCS